MASELYSGPMALAQSKHASPQRKTVLAVPSATVAPPVRFFAGNTIATKGQVATIASDTTVNMVPSNADTQLAVIQGNALKKEVEQHAAKFSHTVSNAVKNTRQLLQLLRESVTQETAIELKTMEDLWVQLELLFAAANETKGVIPTFLEKQRNNTSLYYASIVQEMIRERQDEMNIQHKKVNIQQEVILEHQEAFQNYQLQTAEKLKELEYLQERNSRLTLEKGNFRTELDNYKQLLEKEISGKNQALQTAASLHEELEVLLSSKTKLQTECDTLREALNELEHKMKNAEQETTNRFAAELQTTAAELARECKATTDLKDIIANLRGDESNIKLEAGKVKVENKLISEKYKTLSAEHAEAFTKLNAQIKKVEDLSIEAECMQKDNTKLKNQVAELCGSQNQIAELVSVKSSLMTQVESLDKEKKAQEEKVRGLEGEKKSLETALREWTDLAKRSYNEYKEMLPTYRQADRYRQDALDKENTIKSLKLELSTSRAPNPNGMSAVGDGAYWKGKYESLLAAVGG